MTKSSSSTAVEEMPSKFQVWKLAARPHTLTASFIPVVVGYALTLQLIYNDYNADIVSVSSSSSDSNVMLSSAYCSSSSSSNHATTSCQVDQQLSNHLLPPPPLLSLAIQFAIFAMLIQISTNLHNDYADFVKGADTHERVGQARATQRGWLTPSETCRGCAICMAGALLVGLVYLIPMSDANARCDAVSRGNLEARWWWFWADKYDPIMIFIVLSSLFNAVAYTGGPFPLGYIGLGNLSIGYSGLGDLFVFLYFGIVATVGLPYLYLTKLSCRVFPFSRNNGQALWTLLQLLHPSLLHSIPVGCLATAIIVVNNLRDRRTDVHAGKRTMAVRFGGTFAKIEYFILVTGSYGFCIYRWFVGRVTYSSTDGWTTLLPLLSFPMAIPQLNAVAFGGKDGQDLNAHVGGTAKVQVMYCLLMALGLAMSSHR